MQESLTLGTPSQFLLFKVCLYFFMLKCLYNLNPFKHNQVTNIYIFRATWTITTSVLQKLLHVQKDQVKGQN